MSASQVQVKPFHGLWGKSILRIRLLLEMVRFSHTLFALPFALIALLTASNGLPSPGLFIKILLAMVFARTAAMTFNRLVDLPFDRANPRTKMRHLVQGTIQPAFAWSIFAINALGFLVVAFLLNPLAGKLSFPTLSVLLFYSYTKRFTASSHLFLGLALALAPLGAWVATTGQLSWNAFPLALGVAFWVAGFDMIYATQDESFDRQFGLHSAVVRLGRKKALWLSRGLHAFVVPCFLLFGYCNENLGMFFQLACLAIAGLLIYEHALVKPTGDLARINEAFFRVNGIISLLLLVASGLDLFWHLKGI